MTDEQEREGQKSAQQASNIPSDYDLEKCFYAADLVDAICGNYEAIINRHRTTIGMYR